MATFPVKFYTDQMGGIPALSATNGAMTTLLDAVLVNGFNLKSVTSITVNGTAAEVVIGASHGFIKDQIVLISGANESYWNSEFRVAAVGSISIMIDVPGGTPNASGTILIKTPSLGYEITHTASYIRCYRSLDSTSKKFVLRVDDGNDQTTANGYNSTYSKRAKVTAFKDTTQLDLYGITGVSGTGVFNTYDQIPCESYGSSKNHAIQSGSGGPTVVDGWFKWYYAIHNTANYIIESSGFVTGNRNFTIIGDSKGFFLFNNIDQSSFIGTRTQYYFGEYDSIFGSTDPNACILSATEAYNSANNNTAGLPTSQTIGSSWGSTAYVYGPAGGNSGMAQIYPGAGLRLMRDATGLGTANTSQIFHNVTVVQNLASSTGWRSGYDTGGFPYPNGISYTLPIFPIYIQDYGGIMRGKWPGVYFVCSNIQGSAALANNEIIDSVYGYSGRRFIAVRPEVGSTSSASVPGRLLIDITGPWRN